MIPTVVKMNKIRGTEFLGLRFRVAGLRSEPRSFGFLGIKC